VHLLVDKVILRNWCNNKVYTNVDVSHDDGMDVAADMTGRYNMVAVGEICGT